MPPGAVGVGEERERFAGRRTWGVCTGAPSNEGKLSTEKEAPLLIFLGVRNGVGAGGGSMLCGLGQTAPSVGLSVPVCEVGWNWLD